MARNKDGNSQKWRCRRTKGQNITATGNGQSRALAGNIPPIVYAHISCEKSFLATMGAFLSAAALHFNCPTFRSPRFRDYKGAFGRGDLAWHSSAHSFGQGRELHKPYDTTFTFHLSLGDMLIVWALGDFKWYSWEFPKRKSTMEISLFFFFLLFPLFDLEEFQWKINHEFRKLKNFSNSWKIA